MLLNRTRSPFNGASRWPLLLAALLFALQATTMQTIVVSAEETSGGEVPAQRLKLTVYYETLCPDSRRFVYNDLYPAMIDNDWLQYAELEFVPYGKVSNWTNPSTNEVILSCQHGRRECELNAVHACIVEHNSEREQLVMINCMMLNSQKSIDQCASELGVNVDAAKQCKATRSVSDILYKYGQKTNAIQISFVPSTAFDGVFKADEQMTIFYNFDTTFCSHYKAKFNKVLNHC